MSNLLAKAFKKAKKKKRTEPLTSEPEPLSNTSLASVRSILGASVQASMLKRDQPPPVTSGLVNESSYTDAEIQDIVSGFSLEGVDLSNIKSTEQVGQELGDIFSEENMRGSAVRGLQPVMETLTQSSSMFKTNLPGPQIPKGGLEQKTTLSDFADQILLDKHKIVAGAIFFLIVGAIVIKR
jgi:hypothetical protein